MIPHRLTASCRVCGHVPLLDYLDLGNQPLANALPLATSTLPDARLPLKLAACVRCGLSQLTHVVDAATLFARDYPYQSGVSASWRAHCDALATEVACKSGLAYDLGGNDNTLRDALRAAGMRATSVDPAGDDITYPWSETLARTLKPAALICATNVLAHVDDVHDFVTGIKIALAPDGLCVVETPLLDYLIAHCAFDTVYHEHLSYWSLHALHALFDQHDLQIARVRHLPALHGGSVRLFVTHGRAHDQRVVASEGILRFRDPATYETFAADVHRTLRMIDSDLLESEPFYGYSAPAKATVLLNLLAARPVACFEDSPNKQGRRVPGTTVPIVAPRVLADVSRLALFAWNWREDLKRRARSLGFRGRFFVPLPWPRWED